MHRTINLGSSISIWNRIRVTLVSAGSRDQEKKSIWINEQKAEKIWAIPRLWISLFAQVSFLQIVSNFQIQPMRVMRTSSSEKLQIANEP